MERAVAAGKDVSVMASVASFFVSRVDTEVDARLDKIGTPEAAALRGRAAIASARIAYEHYERVCPEATMRLVADHGVIPADSVRDYYADAHQVLDQLAQLGIDYDDVVQALEDNGVAAFDASWAKLGERLAATLHGT